MENKITGECFCGDVVYEYEGSLSDARSCHCSRCRKAFSSQASALAIIDSDKFNWVSGENRLTTYTGEHGYGYQFCRKCGSTLVIVHLGVVFGVTLGCLNGNPEVTLERHIFVGSKASWETIPDNAPHFTESPE